MQIYIWDDTSGVASDILAYVLVIPTDKNIDTINIVPVYTNAEYKNIKKYGTPYNPSYISFEKPIIYLYPTEETEISVKLLKDENLTCSYPKYQDEWNVLAQPNGDLKDLKTNRKLYSLYYESKCPKASKVESDGFILKGQDTVEFLEKKISYFRINRERN